MSNAKRVVAWAVVGMLLAASSSYAGGGSKRNGTIKFVNRSGGVVYVTDNATSSSIEAAFSAKNLTAFENAGGKKVNAGSSVTFSVAAGMWDVGAADAKLDGPIAENVSVAQGSTVTVYINKKAASPYIFFSTGT